ncbi:hypothetical protein F2P81_011138 [Scophthalmus maximus]|uniref:Uncharacterized protein n=1 Tax=Scophthalmus maximus TaxID=52904 RepID=A0A6A4SKR5_SCOMX|nr:hypothetical protein F2P81_011138 [Scophthalmus maximus]
MLSDLSSTAIKKDAAHRGNFTSRRLQKYAKTRSLIFRAVTQRRYPCEQPAAAHYAKSNKTAELSLESQRNTSKYSLTTHIAEDLRRLPVSGYGDNGRQRIDQQQA